MNLSLIANVGINLNLLQKFYGILSKNVWSIKGFFVI